MSRRLCTRPLMSVTNAISSIIAVGALIQVGAAARCRTEGRPDVLILGLAVVALTLTAVNMFGGFAVTRRMLAMFRKVRGHKHVANLATVAYIAATILFILSLGGLSNPETSRRGNSYGILGMAIAVLATVFGPRVTPPAFPGSSERWWWRQRRPVRGPQGADDADARAGRTDAQPRRPRGVPRRLRELHRHVDRVRRRREGHHEVEIYLGILIGAVTFSGSVIAFGKLSGKIGGKPMLLPARHWLNLAGLLAVIWFGVQFLQAHDVATGMMPLVLMTVIALLFGVHMVMAIGGADMPVVVSMLNSYSGWAAAATGFMLSNDLLIVTGALVGSSGAILSYIMCRAMNRNFISVIAGGFGTAKAQHRRRRRAAGRRSDSHQRD